MGAQMLGYWSIDELPDGNAQHVAAETGSDRL